MNRLKLPKHLEFIRSLPCVICGNNIETEAAHVRYADYRAAKEEAGRGRKPDDTWTVPLCSAHHRRQHTGSEELFWRQTGLDPIFLALAFYRVSGDHAKGSQICEWANISFINKKALDKVG